jgi:hypothetical protein
MPKEEKQYYQPTAYDVNYPTVVYSVFETIKVFVCEVLYSHEEYRISEKRFIRTDFSGGDDASIRRSIEEFKTMQGKFPFTAYGIWDDETINKIISYKAKSGRYYSNIFGCYVKTFPVQITIPMVSFFTTLSDWERASQLLYNESCMPTRLNIPILVNDNLTSFVANIDIEVQKGSFAGQFDEHLKIGNINGLSHNFIINFHYFYIDATDHHGNTLTVAPVDNIYTSFYSFNNPDYRDNPTLQNYATNFSIPEIESTVPVDGAENIGRSDNIVINFNTAMNESAVENYMGIDPFMDINYIWNVASTVLTLEIVTELSANSEYEITIAKEAYSSGDQNLEEDYIFNFTTGA